MERKTATGFVVKTNDGQGMVTAVFAVTGALDLQDDITASGAFKRTFRERGRKVKVLDNHRMGSILDVIGKVMSLREIGRSELPGEVLKQYPGATGGAVANIQMLLDTPEGKGAYLRLKNAAIQEWSWGFDAVKTSYRQASRDGKTVTARVLEDVELYEVSPVIFAAMPGTMTTAVKTRRSDLDLLVEIAQERHELEKLIYGGRTATQLLAEIYLEQEELAKLR